MVDAASLFNGLPVSARQEIAVSSDKQSSLICALINNHEQAVQKLEAENLELRRKVAALSVEVSLLRAKSHNKAKAIQIYPIDLTGSETEQSTLASCEDGSDHSEARADCMSPPTTSVAGKRKHGLGSGDISPAGSPEAKKARPAPGAASSAVATGETSRASSSVPVDPDPTKNQHSAKAVNSSMRPSTALGMDERGVKPPIPIQVPEPIPLSPKPREAPPRAEGNDPGPLGSAPVKNAGRVKPLDFSVLQEAQKTKEPPARMEESSATKVSATLVEREAGLRVAIREARVAQLCGAMSRALAPGAVVSPPASAPNRSNAAAVRTPPQTVPKQTSTADKGQKMVTWYAKRGVADAGPAQSPRAVGSFVLTGAAKLPTPTSSAAAVMSQPRGVPPPARAPRQPSLDVPTAGADRP